MLLKLPLIGSKLHTATFGPSLGTHNLVIFYPFLTFNYTKKLIKTSPIVKRYKLYNYISFRSDFGFLSLFLPPVATWATFGVHNQKYPKVVGTCPAYHHKFIAQNRCPRKRPPLNNEERQISARTLPHSNHLKNNIFIRGVNIKKVDKVRFLGVIIDDKLKWDAHISHLETCHP